MGFRLDACKHFDYRFLCDFVSGLFIVAISVIFDCPILRSYSVAAKVSTARKAPGHSRLFSVAEFWSADVTLVLSFMKRLSAPVRLHSFPTPHDANTDSVEFLR